MHVTIALCSSQACISVICCVQSYAAADGAASENDEAVVWWPQPSALSATAGLMSLFPNMRHLHLKPRSMALEAAWGDGGQWNQCHWTDSVCLLGLHLRAQLGLPEITPFPLQWQQGGPPMLPVVRAPALPQPLNAPKIKYPIMGYKQGWPQSVGRQRQVCKKATVGLPNHLNCALEEGDAMVGRNDLCNKRAHVMLNGHVTAHRHDLYAGLLPD